MILSFIMKVAHVLPVQRSGSEVDDKFTEQLAPVIPGRCLVCEITVPVSSRTRVSRLTAQTVVLRSSYTAVLQVQIKALSTSISSPTFFKCSDTFLLLSVEFPSSKQLFSFRFRFSTASDGQFVPALEVTLPFLRIGVRFVGSEIPSVPGSSFRIGGTTLF